MLACIKRVSLKFRQGCICSTHILLMDIYNVLHCKLIQYMPKTGAYHSLASTVALEDLHKRAYVFLLSLPHQYFQVNVASLQ